MAAPACAPDLEDGELFLPKDIFPDEDDLMLWRGYTDDALPVNHPEGFNYGANDDVDLDFDLNELATKLAALGLGLGVLPRRGGAECRGGSNTTTTTTTTNNNINSFAAPLAPPTPPLPVFARCGADSFRFDRRPSLPPRKQQHQQPQSPWVLGPRAAEALMLHRQQQLHQRQQRASAIFAARASALGIPVVDMEGGAGSVPTGFGATETSLLMPRVCSGGAARGFPAVTTQACNGAVATLGPAVGPTYVARNHLLPHSRGLPISVAARRRSGGTGVFLPRVSSPTAFSAPAAAAAATPASTAAAMMKHKVEHHPHQLLRYQQHLAPSAPPVATACPSSGGFSTNRGFSMMTGMDGAPYRGMPTPPPPPVDWSSYF